MVPQLRWLHSTLDPWSIVTLHIRCRLGLFPETPIDTGAFRKHASGRLIWRPRKDGTRTDTSPTLKDLGISKREATRMRRLASLSADEFEAALAQWRTNNREGGPRRSIESFLPDRRNNSRHEREIAANISRIISTARAIAQAHDVDASRTGEMMRRISRFTEELWLPLKSELGLKAKRK